MKKFLAILLMATMTLSLAACGAKTSENYEQIELPTKKPGESWLNPGDYAEDKGNAENKKAVLKIEDTSTPDMVFGQALEVFHTTKFYEYYFNCTMSGVIIVTYEDGTTENVKEAFDNGHITIEDLDEHGISYQRKRISNFGNRNNTTDETIQENVTETAPAKENE